MKIWLAIFVGRIVRRLAKMRGGGSAIPGRLAMIIDSQFLEKTIGKLPYGVVFVSGSNGKSTTTALVTAALRSQNLRVFSNPSGGNMPQGIASAVVGKANFAGDIKSDIAVLEVDEAYGPLLAKNVRPTWVVLTNVQIDQLNRFYEPERVLEMLLAAANASTRGVVINGSDANLVAIANRIKNDSLNISQITVSDSELAKWPVGALAAPIFNKPKASKTIPVCCEVISERDGIGVFSVDSSPTSIKLPGKGLHFAIDAGLALGLTSEITGTKFNLEAATQEISKQETVYGRGEIVKYKNQEFQILMMKNPSSLRATLISMDKPQTSVWIAIDEGTPDPSWIYDINLEPLGGVEVISGSRAWHWATRLSYSDTAVGKVITSSTQALEEYVEHLSRVNKRGTLLTNYEQMMIIRRHMGFLDLESGK